MPALLEEPRVETEALPNTNVPTHEEIELRAYFRYAERGYVDGFDVEDWLAAEDELRHESEA